MQSSPRICPACGKETKPWSGQLPDLLIGLDGIELCLTPDCRIKTINEAVRQRDLEHPEIRLAKCGVPRRFLRASFENFEFHEDVIEVCKRHVDSDESLSLLGRAGTGKTHLGVAILREKVRRYSEHSLLFVSAPKLLLQFGQAFDEDVDFNEAEFLRKLVEVKVLLVDDMGQHSSNRWVRSKFYSVLDGRYCEERQTIVTSNLDLDGIEEHLGAPIASRIAEDQVLSLQFCDYRRRRFEDSK